MPPPSPAKRSSTRFKSLTSRHHDRHRPRSTTPFPPELINATWVCAASTGSTCAPISGTGDITNVAVTLLPLGVATFTITVTVDPTFQGGTITNAATATPGEHTLCAEDRAQPAARRRSR